MHIRVLLDSQRHLGCKKSAERSSEIFCMRRFGDRILVTALWSFLQTSPRVAHIYGTKGRIAVERVNCPERVTLTTHGSEPKVCTTAVEEALIMLFRCNIGFC